MNAQPLFGLTLHRPWERVIVRGIKKIENRSWHPEPRLRPGEWFAIHAGKKYDDRCSPMATRLGVDYDLFLEPGWPEGHIVGFAQYGGFTRASDDPWFFGPIGWLLPKAFAIDPIPCRGAQKLWEVKGQELELCRKAWRKARAA